MKHFTDKRLHPCGQRAKAVLTAQRVLPLDSYAGIARSLIASARDAAAQDEVESAFWKTLAETTPADVLQAMQRIDQNGFVSTVIEP